MKAGIVITEDFRLLGINIALEFYKLLKKTRAQGGPWLKEFLMISFRPNHVVRPSLPKPQEE